ncbi:MAG: zinc carboxypeptidase [Candidatus Cloacimonetes bacterium]|jgi:hypothetical protein|nr:zinc carboxypeptidase [Candidatus Cloacimonadota bacterium]MCK9184252.1 zinc carboxypeptidase [Candidatus Cloacimonadota bacterium]MCK9583833.1 zinc carboxypeptidase [Candidatus Cloacimonadota bacterium]
MRKALLIIILILLSLPVWAGEWTQYYFRFELLNKAELQNLSTVISIDNIKGNWVYAYANDQEWEEFSALGYKTQLLPAPASEFPAIMTNDQRELRSWDAYPTYEAYVAMMYGFATDYPNLCQIINVGTTVGGRAILIAKISDNVGSSEKEPEILYTGTMHGDEVTGYILLLRYIDTLLSQYGSDPRITNIVNSMELYIGPNTNPDGTYYGGNASVSGARRYNQNGVDLNRNYPNFNGSLNTGAIQTETQVMMDFATAHSFVFGINYHGGAEVVNYPWDYTSALHPDNAWFVSSSLLYASKAQANGPSGYFTGINSNGITNGAAWYSIAGGRQDWMNYTRNGREVTIECSNTKMPAAGAMPNYWNYNYEALLSYTEQALFGIHGTVKDAYGNPLPASITVVNHDNAYSIVETDPSHGDFYRYLSPGSYDLLVSTPSYEDILVQNVIVSSNSSTPLEIIFGELPDLQEISLSAGWNQISFNVLPEEPSAILAQIPHLEQIKSLTKSYNSSLPAHLNTLTSLDPRLGYYVKVLSPSVFEIEGTLVQPQSIALKAGWNFIGYTPDTPQAVNTALASVLPCLLELRHGDLSYSQGTLQQMQPGKGYWVQLSQDCILEF